MTDYVLYIHGANVREKTYAANMDAGLQKRFRGNLKTTTVYWGDIAEAAEQKVLKQWQSSQLWPRLCFPNLRANMLLQLIGDGALYISRTVGASIVERIYQAVNAGFTDRKSGDRVHLVTHSWGAVIVLDMLFADRWLDDDAPGKEHVLAMREALFGMGKEQSEGLVLSSIITMGSPMSLFSLMNNDSSEHITSSHNISQDMRRYCRALFDAKKTPLKWQNFIQPADAFAYPSSPLLDAMLQDQKDTVDAQDLLVKNNPLNTLLIALIGKTDLALLGAAQAHNGYWDNPRVITTIAKFIQTASKEQKRK
jgi:hypothetical protein